MNEGPVIGLALGSGAARGLAHIGIIRALSREGIEPDIICGTSIGALIGASYLTGRMERLEQWARSVTRLDTARFFEITTPLQGFVNRERLHEFLNSNVTDDETLIESRDRRYAAVATDLETGREIWMDHGPLIKAVWASISLPGLFPAIRHRQRWLVDGGLVNPVPVSVCRALGADVVIAVNLNGDIVGKHLRKRRPQSKTDNGMMGRLSDLVREYTGTLFPTSRNGDQPPNLIDAIAGSFNIMQDRITRSRMAGDPPDFLLSPRLSHIGLLEFYRAAEAIVEGEKCVTRILPEISERIEGNRAS